MRYNPSMHNLISVDELIKKAKSKGINFGGGDPYNRLRYYTKIGWLPHMVRKITKKRNVEGHYPEWVLERLKFISEWKERGLSNFEIERRIAAENIRRNFGRVFSFLNTSEERKRAAALLIAGIFILIIGSELGLFSKTSTKGDLLRRSQEGTILTGSAVEVSSSGSGIMPNGVKTVFVKAPAVFATSKVYVTFTDDYSPAIRFWVSNVISSEGFYIELDSPTAQNASFSWWTSN